MSVDDFAAIDRVVRSGGHDETLEFLATQFRDEKKLPQLFEVRLMTARHKLGLPMIQTQPLADLEEDTRRSYEDAYIAAAREVGGLFLESGDIVRAWPYFRAIGETGPVAAAIERVEPGPGIEPIIEIAFHERAHPRKGFELILANYGTCSAITSFEQYPSREGREDCTRILLRKLHGDLVESLRHAIADREGQMPDSHSIPALIANRDWLFEENNYHVDTSHLAAVVRFSIELRDRPSLAMAIDLAEYGKKLSSLFHYRGNPPFENAYVDYGVYLQTMLGDTPEPGIAHFRQKLDGSESGELASPAAQALVTLLARLGRYSEAIDVSVQYLRDVDPGYLSCPNAVQLCEMAGDHERMKVVAKSQDDLLSYAAAALCEESRKRASNGVGGK
jgi:hypothetical protein